MLDLDFIADDVKAYLDEKDIKPKIWKRENIAGFFNRSAYAISLISREKEILLFSALQWIAIALVGLLWGEMLGWIPHELLNVRSLHDFLVDFAVFAWSFLCTALAAYPIAVFTAAMGAAHFLRQQGQPSTIGACLQLALPNASRLWIFYLWDGWQTFNWIIDNVPRKGGGDFRFAERRALAKATHHAWKTGTLGMPPALLLGRGLIEAASESVSLLKKRSTEVVKLRGGYAAICGIVILAGLMATTMLFIFGLTPPKGTAPRTIYVLWIGVPMFAIIGVIELLVRPVYVIAACQMYSEFRKETRKPIKFGKPSDRGLNVLAAFLAACVILSLVAVYRDQVGLGDLMAIPARAQ